MSTAADEAEAEAAAAAKKTAARAAISARVRTTPGSLNLPAPERAKAAVKPVTKTAVSKKDSPTRSGQRLTADQLVRMSKPEIAAVAHQRGYSRLHSGTEGLRAKFLAAQAADASLEPEKTS